jgi:hypothetical protein
MGRNSAPLICPPPYIPFAISLQMLLRRHRCSAAPRARVSPAGAVRCHATAGPWLQERRTLLEPPALAG